MALKRVITLNTGQFEELQDGDAIEFLPALGTDHTYSGLAASRTIDVGEIVAFGDLLFIASDFELELAKADTAATMPAMFMSTGAGTGAQDVIKAGSYVRDDSWAWTAGYIYPDRVTAGGMTQSLTGYTTNNIVQPVALAISADIIYFDPSISVVTKAS